ncbi:MAG: hypothetical protein KKD64_03575 [Alphaproteobacteria bacterium]|nr:hypothetical protein [Alphaproteobacteria bacterium]MBU0794809.1 hypothetical protein [Alphaproteobacteria bacterium]MBU1768715.1 hypothetical protein [Alphaproteobacteria bacterium]
MVSIEQHLANPHVSIEAHIGHRCQELAADLVTRRPIYLDFRFWVIAREVRAGIRNDPFERKLVHHLERLARQGKIFCPISATTFVELMKIGDDLRRRATLDVIEELSHGVSLMPEPDRVEDELETIFRVALTSKPTALRRVWTRLAYVMGNFHVSDNRFPPDVELAIQKAFFDHVWERPLSEVAASIDRAEFDMSGEMASLAEKLNEGNRIHQSEMTSFEAVLGTETRGVSEIAEPIFGQLVARLGDFRSDQARSEQSVRIATNFVQAILSGEHRNKLPTIHVHASLQALFRWEYRSKKITGNDLFDFGHAAAALGYCDAFFTEAGITRAIAHPRINLGTLYGCFVTNDVEQALGYLQALSGAEVPSSESRR